MRKYKRKVVEKASIMPPAISARVSSNRNVRLVTFGSATVFPNGEEPAGRKSFGVSHFGIPMENEIR
jgi:hypothetical protein